jgi:hypothetical protein
VSRRPPRTATRQSSTGARHAAGTDTRAAVDTFMDALVHPHRDAVEALRQVFRDVSPEVAEGVKWNAPSWRADEYFATTRLRDPVGIGLVLHFGARVRPGWRRPAIDDPQRLLQWLAGDRAAVSFTGLADLQARREALLAVLRQWIAVLRAATPHG